jgi:hypothetical protein
MPFSTEPPHDEEPVLVGARRSGIPSAVAQSRLSDALRGRATAYRHDAAVDLTLVDALLRMDQPEAAARQLDDHRASLQAMARDLQVVVADAAVEREAELVYQACAASLAPDAQPSSLRRRVLAMAGAAAVMLALLLPTGRIVPRTTLANLMDRDSALDDEVVAARDRLEAARFWARLARDGSEIAATTTTASPRARALVREKVRSIVDDGFDQAATATVSSAQVASLDEHRRNREGTTTDTETSDDGDTLAPVIQIKDAPSAVPGGPEPLKSGVPIEPEHTQVGAPVDAGAVTDVVTDDTNR